MIKISPYVAPGIALNNNGNISDFIKNYKAENSSIRLLHIRNVVCAYFNLVPDELLLSKKRNNNIPKTRHYIILFAREKGIQNNEIRSVVGITESAISTAYNTIQTRRKIYKSINEEIKILSDKLNDGLINN